MEALKYSRAKAPDPLPESARLFRVSWLQRTVRYEWYMGGKYLFGPVFQATAQEWERALD